MDYAVDCKLQVVAEVSRLEAVSGVLEKARGASVAKLRFEYLAQPEIVAKDVRVTLENGRLSEANQRFKFRMNIPPLAQ